MDSIIQESKLIDQFYKFSKIFSKKKKKIRIDYEIKNSPMPRLIVFLEIDIAIGCWMFDCQSGRENLMQI